MLQAEMRPQEGPVPLRPRTALVTGPLSDHTLAALGVSCLFRMRPHP